MIPIDFLYDVCLLQCRYPYNDCAPGQSCTGLIREYGVLRTPAWNIGSAIAFSIAICTKSISKTNYFHSIRISSASAWPAATDQTKNKICLLANWIIYFAVKSPKVCDCWICNFNIFVCGKLTDYSQIHLFNIAYLFDEIMKFKYIYLCTCMNIVDVKNYITAQALDEK